MIDLNKLNPEQRAAVEQTEGPLLVLAGAGSGKTRVLTYRVALLLEKGVAPWKILAITFTNKAAREMQERVEALAGEACDDAWISTFHSACVRILRQCIERLGYKRSFTIYDESDCQTLIKNILKKMNVTEKEYTPKQVKFIISDAKNTALGPDEWLKQSEGTFRDKKLRDIYAEYEKTLKSNNALDFDDLLLKTLYLLTTDPELLRYWQNRFQYVLVDEFQDTNDVQYEIVHLLASEHRNLCIVGDDDQSIYGWRGANVENFFAFEKDFPECVTVKLERNYRSTGNILDAANQVIAHNAGRKEKMLWTEADAGDLITLYTAADERTEAAFICGRIQNLLRDGTKPGEIAVLYRTNAQSRLIEEQLVRTRLPYRVFGGQKFYDRKEVKDLLGYLRLLVNNDDDISLRRVINEPKRGIGESTVDKLAEYAEECGMPMMTALFLTDAIDLGSRPKKLLAAFSELLLSLAADAENMSPAEVLDMVIERTGYVKALEAGKSEEDQSRIENIKELQGSVTQFTDTHPGATLSDYLEN
ncbi:MAG: UvrD-helicase domain-containing protein, partial [Clostridia bacterium]|nr:UvrD-helicase domain-containing protein [Clostridia bacterium]